MGIIFNMIKVCGCLFGKSVIVVSKLYLARRH